MMIAHFRDRAAAGAPFRADIAEYTTTTLISRWTGVRRADYYEVMAVLEGTGWQGLSNGSVVGEKEIIRAGQMFFLRPTDTQDFGATAGRGMIVGFMSLPASSWLRFANLAGIPASWYTRPHAPRARFDWTDTASAAPFHEAYARYHDHPNGFDLLRFLSAVIPRFLDEADTTRDGAPTWLIESVEQMREETNLRAGLARLRELAHVSESYLGRVMRQFFGASPIEMVTRLRLAHAADLLATTDESVGRIANRCGFSSMSYFSNQFRQAHQISPSRYRSAARALQTAGAQNSMLDRAAIDYARPVPINANSGGTPHIR